MLTSSDVDHTYTHTYDALDRLTKDVLVIPGLT
jgi:hypothetical protein